MNSKQQELKWQAESDARTLASYQEIMNDKARRTRAIKEAQQQASDLTKRANAMKTAASYGKGGRMSTSRKKK